MFTITNLSVSVAEKQILKNFSLTITPGSTHAIMGPNGSGKSTLAATIAGHPYYQVTSGSMAFKEQELTALSPEKRAKLGIFLACQSPPAIPGVPVLTFLKEAHQAVGQVTVSVTEFRAQLEPYLDLLKIDPLFLTRSLHDGFSGGERKRFEMLQLLVLKPQFVVLDEIDSGLDIDALALVADALAHARSNNPEMAVLLITHYQRILDYIHPDHVHVLCDGEIKESGTHELVVTLERTGYHAYRS